MSRLSNYFWFLFVFSVFRVQALRNSEENQISQTNTARTMLERITSSLLSKSDRSSSQVLSLNITNLLILALLKALIFAAGSIGAGSWKDGFGRDLNDEEEIVTDSEFLLYLSYMSGSPGHYECLQYVACNNPKMSMKYVKAGTILLKLSNYVPSLQRNRTYRDILLDLRKAAHYGQTGGKCDTKYVCSNK